jgi:PAS domain S-box-containing protein
MAARHSLRVRLPLLISTLLVVVATIFLWGAYREVEATLVRMGGERARGAADQVATLISRSSLSSMESLHRAAADADVARYLQNPTDDARDAARARLAPLATPGIRSIELWSAAGSPVLTVPIPAVDVRGAALIELPAMPRLPPSGFNNFQAANDLLFHDTATEVPGERRTGQPSMPDRLGYIVVRSTISETPPGALGRLIGVDAVIEIGNTAGGIWWNLSKSVDAPGVDLTRSGVGEYRRANGEARLGALSTIRGTPWAVWVEFPRSVIVAPAHAFLARMMWFAAIGVAIGALLVARVSVRLTRPIRELARAADRIAAGDYFQQVAAPRPDEIGQLGRAFNAMVAEVTDNHRQLETRALERGRALEALRASEAHYRAIVEVALDCIITIDAQGLIVEFNPAAEKTFGYRKVDVVGRELAALIVPPELRDAHRQGLARHIATGERAVIGRRIEMTAQRADGTQFPIELAISAVPSDGAPMFTGVARDISERKRMEDLRLKSHAMEQQHHRMVETDRLKDEFLANMSHELRTPLNVIIGFAELMHKGKVGPVSLEHQEYLADILASSRHLLRVINDVLDLSKVEAGKMDFRPEAVDLSRLVNEVRDILRGLAASQGLRIEAEVDPRVATVVIDPARLKQLLYNYVSNAIKFTPAGGRVLIRIAPDGTEMFRIDVEDTGVGIPAGDLGKLFVEFQQLDAGTTKTHQGTGLGLALVKRLAEAQGGSVAVSSIPGRGSTFSAILPRRMAIAPDVGVQPAIGAFPADQTILVVDDDPATLKLADVALRELGHRPVCRNNAADALRAAEADPPAAVIVDLLMPQMDGFEFISRLRALPGLRDVPVLVWTVKDLDANERRRLQGSAVAMAFKGAGGAQSLVQELERLLPSASLPALAHDGE